MKSSVISRYRFVKYYPKHSESVSEFLFRAEVLLKPEEVLLTLTPEELEILLIAVGKYVTYSRSISAFRFLNKLEFVSPNPGDACRHSVQSSGVVGQGGTK